MKRRIMTAVEVHQKGPKDRTTETWKPPRVGVGQKRVLHALIQRPERGTLVSVSPSEILSQRLSGLPRGGISHVVSQLNGMGLTDLKSLKTPRTGHGARDLRAAVTPLGRRLLRHLKGR